MLQAAEPQRVWRVELGNRADLAAMLRNFLRRQGLAAELRGPAAIEVTTGVRRSDLLAHLAQWEAVTEVPARLEEGRQGVTQPTDAFAATARPRLGELLTARRLITPEELTQALKDSREAGELLGVFLVNKQLIFEDELARTLSQQLSVPYISVMRVGVDAQAARLMPSEEGLRVAAIPVRFDGDEVQVAFADPTDREALDTVAGFVGSTRVAVSELSDIRMAWRQYGQADAR